MPLKGSHSATVTYLIAIHKNESTNALTTPFAQSAAILNQGVHWWQCAPPLTPLRAAGRLDHERHGAWQHPVRQGAGPGALRPGRRGLQPGARPGGAPTNTGALPKAKPCLHLPDVCHARLQKSFCVLSAWQDVSLGALKAVLAVCCH